MPLIRKIRTFKYIKHFIKTKHIYMHSDYALLSGYAIKIKKEALFDLNQIAILFDYLGEILEAGGEIKHLPKPYELIKANSKE